MGPRSPSSRVFWFLSVFFQFFFLGPETGKNYNAGVTDEGILICIVAAFVVFITIIGSKHLGSHFKKSKTCCW